MPRSHILVLALLAAPAASAQVAGDAAARLVPEDAVAVVRLESIEAWNALVRSFGPLAGDGSLAEYDAAAVLAEMQDPDAAEPGVLDPTRPVYLALAVPTGGRPAPTAILPIAGSAPITLHPMFATGAETTVVLDGWCAISLAPGYAARAEPSALLAGLPPGVASVHVDLAGLIETFRPLIETGLDQAEMALDQLGQVESPFDVQLLMETYLDAARDLIDAARSLDVALERQGSELALVFDYTERTDTTGTTGAGAPAEEVVTADVASLAARLDPESAAQIAFNGRWQDVLELSGDFAEAVVDAYPEPLSTDLGRMLDAMDELAPLLEPGLAMQADFGADGMRGLYLLRSSSPADVVARLESTMIALGHENGMVRFAPAETRTFGDLEARVLPFEVRYESLAPLVAAQPGTDVDSAEAMEEVFASVYGRAPRFALAPSGELVLVAIAGSDAALETLLTGVVGRESPSPRLERLLARIPPGATGFAYALDFGRMMERIGDLMQAVAPGAPMPSMPARLDTWGSHRGATWTFGMAIDVAEVVAFAQALQELEER